MCRARISLFPDDLVSGELILGCKQLVPIGLCKADGGGLYPATLIMFGEKVFMMVLVVRYAGCISLVGLREPSPRGQAFTPIWCWLNALTRELVLSSAAAMCEGDTDVAVDERVWCDGCRVLDVLQPEAIAKSRWCRASRGGHGVGLSSILTSTHGAELCLTGYESLPCFAFSKVKPVAGAFPGKEVKSFRIYTGRWMIVVGLVFVVAIWKWVRGTDLRIGGEPGVTTVRLISRGYERCSTVSGFPTGYIDNLHDLDILFVTGAWGVEAGAGAVGVGTVDANLELVQLDLLFINE
ncbi:hypothetical protein Tco_1060190 [Tanacetum coccineum]